MSVDLPIPFRPLHDDFLGLAMTAALRSQSLESLVPDVPGVGVYALYYLPSDPPDDELLSSYAKRCRGAKLPLYVGVAVKADREGADGSRALKSRIAIHRKKLDAALDLSADDFKCRALVCDNRWAALVEEYLIQVYAPVWNLRVSGFGSNVRGSGRKDQKASRWEVLHQGVSSPRWSRAEIAADVANHLMATHGKPAYRFTDR